MSYPSREKSVLNTRTNAGRNMARGARQQQGLDDERIHRLESEIKELRDGHSTMKEQLGQVNMTVMLKLADQDKDALKVASELKTGMTELKSFVETKMSAFQTDVGAQVNGLKTVIETKNTKTNIWATVGVSLVGGIPAFVLFVYWMIAHSQVK